MYWASSISFCATLCQDSHTVCDKSSPLIPISMGKQACRWGCHGRFEWDAHSCQAPFRSSARAISFDRTPCRMMTADDMRPALGTIPAQRPAAPCVFAKCCSVDLSVAYSGCSYKPSHPVSADALLRLTSRHLSHPCFAGL